MPQRSAQSEMPTRRGRPIDSRVLRAVGLRGQPENTVLAETSGHQPPANPREAALDLLDPKGRAGQAGAAADSNAAMALQGLVRSFYRERYWRPVYADILPASLGVALFDSAVVHGRNRALRFLQEALNTLCGVHRLDVDGIFRKDTMLQRHAWYQRVLVCELLRARQGYCDSVACGDRSATITCRARISSLRVLVRRCFAEPGLHVPGRESGLGLTC